MHNSPKIILIEDMTLVKTKNKKPFFRRNYNEQNNPNFKGGKRDKWGYIRVLKRDHHFADKDGRVRLHRLVYEEYYKCIIMPWGKIDHKDNNKRNNSIENLELMNQSKHVSRHNKVDMSDRICLLCKSITTYKTKKGFYMWFKKDDGFICSKCKDKERYNKVRKNV